MVNNKDLFFKLLLADTSNEVKQILKKHNLWDNDKLWRNYGDKENNFSTINNQQKSPGKALIEKLTNLNDSRLTAKCYESSISPDDINNAPRNIKEAVAKFFYNKNSKNYEEDGSIANWPNSLRKEVADSSAIWVTEKDAKHNMCILVGDMGEGQTPKEMPETILSIGAGNKEKVFFNQGTFNMGGTGALRFCSEYCQLVISKRNTNILKNFPIDDPDQDCWSFTVTRRDKPKQKDGREVNKSSIISYLAPINFESKPKKGDLLTFRAEELSIFPDWSKEKNLHEPHIRSIPYGTVFKLYEYDIPKRTNIIMGGGLKDYLEPLMPESALPIRFHETRNKTKGKSASFNTGFFGLSVRFENWMTKESDQNRNKIESLQDSEKGSSLEKIGPQNEIINVDGSEFIVNYYATKKGSYSHLDNTGIIYSYNGQSQHEFPASFFTRQKIKLSIIAKNILVIVDCSKIDNARREDLFTSNRDGISKTEFSDKLEKILEDVIANHEGYQELREKRRAESTKDIFKDDKQLEDIVGKLIKKHKNMAEIFGVGQRLSSRVYVKPVGREGDTKYKGEKHPEFFIHFKTKNDEIFKKATPINNKIKFDFATNTVNEYFSRRNYKGKLSAYYSKDGNELKLENDHYNINNGLIKFTSEWPESINVGEKLKIRFVLEDSTGINFKLNSEITAKARVLKPKVQSRAGGSRGTNKDNPGGSGNTYVQKEPGINLPKLNWKEIGEDPADFTAYDAIKIIDDDWFINSENHFLSLELAEVSKKNRSATAISTYKEQYRLAMALTGISSKYMFEKSKDKDKQVKINEFIQNSANSIAPVINTIMQDIQKMAADLEIEKVKEFED